MKNLYDLVLIIDDNRVSNFFNKLTIEKTKISKRVITIDNKEEAYHFISPKKTLKPIPDIILLNLYMLDMNGWEFLEKFNSLKKSNNCKFIIMSNDDLLPEEQMKLNQYSFVISVSTKNITSEFIENVLDEEVILISSTFNQQVSFN